MKKFTAVLFLLMIGLCAVHAQDMINLKDGNVIEAKVIEINPSEIRYKRFNNLDGPTIVIPTDRVLSIKYKNGVVDIINADAPAQTTPVQTTPPQTGQAGIPLPADVKLPPGQLGPPTPLQSLLNTLPAIRVAGNSLKFEFGGSVWVARVNGENFSAGTIVIEETDSGVILTLQQTHIWPGAMGKTAGRIAGMIPGAGAAAGALNAAGDIAANAGAIEAPGTEIVLEYKAGPPAKLSLVRTGKTTGETAGGNRLDLDGVNVFAISLSAVPTFWWSWGGGATITVFERYKPGTFFTPSYFLAFRLLSRSMGDVFTTEHPIFDFNNSSYTLGAGVLFKHRFPGNRVLWNLGASLELMGVSVHKDNESFEYTYQVYDSFSNSYYNRTGTGWVYYSYEHSTLLGIGIQTGFSFRFNPYISLDLNGLVKFPFESVSLDPHIIGSNGSGNNIVSGGPPAGKSIWPFTGGVELALTFWIPYRSRKQ